MAPDDQGGPPATDGSGRTRRVLRWLFVDRTTGAITVAQFPNIPLWVFVALAVLLRLTQPAGTVGTVLRVLEVAALVVWAGDEIVRGVNPFRRILGSVVLAATVAGAVADLR
jgi:hypothetical protein